MRRAYRLRKSYHFKRVREAGSKWSHRLLTLSAVANRSGKTRVGFIVGKNLGGAVVRNRLKRRTREAVRLLYDQIAPGWDLVFLVRPAVAKASFLELQTAVTQLLRQASLWRSAEPRRADSPSLGREN